MKIDFETLKFKNFLSFGNTVTEFHFKSGLNCVTGPNGSGKSSFTLDALCFNLFGKSYRDINISELINNKNDSKLWTESSFKRDGQNYRIERGLKPSVLKIYKDDVEQELLSHKDLIQEEINKLLGVNHSLFKQIISLSILNNKPFLILPKAEKTNILESIFNIKVFGKMLKTLKKNYTELKSSLDLSDKELDLYKQNLQTFVDQIKELQNAKSEFDSKKEKSIKELEVKIYDCRIKLGSLSSLISEIDLSQFKDNSEKESELKRLIDDLNKHSNSYFSLINRLDDELQFIESTEIDLNALEDRYFEQLKPKLEDILFLLKTIESEKLTFKLNFEKETQKKNSDLESEIKECENEIKVISKEKTFLSKEYLEKNLEEVLNLNKKLSEIKIQVNSLKEEIDKLEVGEGVCDYCRQVIDKEHQIKEIKLREDKIHSLLSERDNIVSEISVIIKNHIKKKNQLIDSDIEGLKIKIESFKQRIQSNNETLQKNIDDKLNALNAQKQNLEKKKSDIVLKEISLIKENLKKEIKEHTEKRKLLKIEKESLEKQLKAIEDQDKEYQEKKSKLEKLQIQKDNLQDNLKELGETLRKSQKDKFNVDIEKMKSEFEEKKKIYLELKNKNAIIKKKIKVSDVIKDVLSEEGIKKFFFSRLIPELNKSINTYLDHFELPVKFEFDSEFEYKIQDFGNERSYQSFSGGERGRIDISIVLSFMKLNKLINDFNCNALFLDELLDSGMDSNALEIILEKLKQLSDEENLCIYVISHKGIETNMYIDNVIKVYKQNGFSKIEV